MGKHLAVFATAILLSGFMVTGSSIALAGVVIHETETIVGERARTRQRTIMIEGNKQKMIEDNREIITDLDKGTTDVIDPAHKMYLEIPFPSQGMAGQEINGLSQPADFVATGNTRTIAGYKCDEYKGAGKFAIGEFSTVSCVSKNAPGSAEYMSFEKAMMAKIKPGSPPAINPDGIPLAQETTTILKPSEIPNMPTQAADELKRQIAQQPPMVTKREVTKVEAQKIGASELQVPAGYTKTEPPGFRSMGESPGSNHGPGAAASSPLPKP